MSELRVHMVGNAHLDPAWMWTWDEGMEAFIATVRSALDRIDETPGFIFTCSSAAHYRWIEDVQPALFERIRSAVASRRWEIVGGWWVQADCNIPSGEGFVRQALIGQRYFMSRFGRMATTGYSPDAFGHNRGLPQLLARAGMTGYIYCRPDPNELALPSPLLEWRSPDGSSVLAYRVPYHYNMYETSVPKKVRDLAVAFAASSPLANGRLDDFGDSWCLFYGVGNHGGGPTREHLAEIGAFDADPAAPDVAFSSPDRFFEDVRADAAVRTIPAWNDDLQIDSPGCYSAHSLIKRLNRQSEHSLLAAESLSSIASLLFGAEYPHDELTRAWEDVCFNHFHDIICGVATREALDDAIDSYGAALSSAKRAIRYAIQRIALAIDTTGDGQTILIVNPHAFAHRANVRFELWHDIDKQLWSKPVDITITDDDGVEVASQTGFTSGKIGRDRIAVTFAAEVPALGWRCYRAHYGTKPAHNSSFPGRAEATMLQNDHLRLSVDAASGAIRVTMLAWHGEQRICDRAAIALVVDDPTDTWGHGVERFDNVIGAFANAQVSLVASGPAFATIRVRSHHGASWIQQDFTLGAGSDAIDVDVSVMWTEQHRMLKLSFPTTIEHAKTHAESAYAVTTKACDGRELPCGTWCGVSGEVDAPAIAIVSDAKHAYSCDVVDGRAELRLSVLRSPSYATHDPHPFNADENLDFVDQGVQRFRYRLVPMPNGLDTARLSREGAAICTPVIAHLESAHEAIATAVGRAFEGISVKPENVRATVIKRAEDSDGWIVRLHECAGKSCDAVVELPSMKTRFECAMGASEVRTFRIDSTAVAEVSLVEYEIPEPRSDAD